ncbi:hypothetical protein ACFY2R_17680 [Micromonospora olivasterospora]|uniref:Transmembrane secretion effector n=1 Tax=Micromonospora olivasterospora TaxID=1880 RepID=A0A562IHF4_MICOL|nr:hypothetical protein JD77_05280 [Micromonospora olivasterospora]
MTRVRHVPTPRRSLRDDLTLGWRAVRARDWYWTSLLAHGVCNGAAAVPLTLGPLVAVDRLGGDGVWVLLQQGGAVGLLAGSLLAGRLRPRSPGGAGLGRPRTAGCRCGTGRARLRRHRRRPRRTSGHLAALHQLVLQSPAPVVTQALGFHHTTTHRHHAAAGGSWNRYSPSRNTL